MRARRRVATSRSISPRLDRRRPAPVACGLAGSRDRGVDLLGAGAPDGSDHLLGVRILDFEEESVPFHLLTIDEQTSLEISHDPIVLVCCAARSAPRP